MIEGHLLQEDRSEGPNKGIEVNRDCKLPHEGKLAVEGFGQNVMDNEYLDIPMPISAMGDEGKLAVERFGQNVTDNEYLDIPMPISAMDHEGKLAVEGFVHLAANLKAIHPGEVSVITAGHDSSASYSSTSRHSTRYGFSYKDDPLPGWQREVSVQIGGKGVGRLRVMFTSPDGLFCLRNRTELLSYASKRTMAMGTLQMFDFRSAYCVCHRSADSRKYLACSFGLAGCQGWLHPECVGLEAVPDEDLDSLGDKVCPLCSLYLEGMRGIHAAPNATMLKRITCPSRTTSESVGHHFVDEASAPHPMWGIIGGGVIDLPLGITATEHTFHRPPPAPVSPVAMEQEFADDHMDLVSLDDESQERYVHHNGEYYEKENKDAGEEVDEEEDDGNVYDDDDDDTYSEASFENSDSDSDNDNDSSGLISDSDGEVETSAKDARRGVCRSRRGGAQGGARGGAKRLAPTPSDEDDDYEIESLESGGPNQRPTRRSPRRGEGRDDDKRARASKKKEKTKEVEQKKGARGERAKGRGASTGSSGNKKRARTWTDSDSSSSDGGGSDEESEGAIEDRGVRRSPRRSSRGGQRGGQGGGRGAAGASSPPRRGSLQQTPVSDGEGDDDDGDDGDDDDGDEDDDDGDYDDDEDDDDDDEEEEEEEGNCKYPSRVSNARNPRARTSSRTRRNGTPKEVDEKKDRRKVRGGRGGGGLLATALPNSVGRGHDLRVEFPHAPLGLTLTKSIVGAAEVTRVVEGGQGEGLGVCVGDVVVGVGKDKGKGKGKGADGVPAYDKTLAKISAHGFPLPLTLRQAPPFAPPSARVNSKKSPRPSTPPPTSSTSSTTTSLSSRKREGPEGVTYIGRSVSKLFKGQGRFTGEVVRSARGLFTVRYSDGDIEDYTLKELLKILTTTGNDK